MHAFDRQTDGRTDRQTDRNLIVRPRLHSMQRGKNDNNHVAIETAGTWNVMAAELVQEIGRRITVITQEPRETMFLFQRLSTALQRGE